MFYEVQAHLFFTSQDEAVDFYHDCQLALNKAQIINSDQDNQEAGFIQLAENHHDLTPAQPCTLLSYEQPQTE